MARSRSRTSPFRKRVLIPFWIARLSILMAEISINALTINFLRINSHRQYLAGTKPVLAVFAALEAILVLCAVLDIICIIKRATHTLTPLFFLVTNLIQTSIFVVLFGVSIAGAFSLLNLLLNIFILLSFVGLLVYASVIFHKHRNGTLPGSYEPAADLSESQKLVVPTGYSASPMETYECPVLSHPRKMAVPTDYSSRSEGYEPYRQNESFGSTQTTAYS